MKIVRCEKCGARLFDGEVILVRIKCRRCKTINTFYNPNAKIIPKDKE